MPLKNPLDRTHLTPLVGAPKRARFGTCDLESKDGPTQKAGFTRIFMAGLYDGTDYQPFFDQTAGGDWKTRYFLPGGCLDRFMRCVLSDKYRGWTFYAHNGGNFDFLFFLPWLVRAKTERDLQVGLVPLGSSGLLAIDVWKTQNKWQRWRFVDSVRLLPMSLQDACKAFGVGEKSTHDDGSRILDQYGNPFTIEAPEHDPGWIPYNEVDCRRLHGVLEKAHDLVELEFKGEIGLTAPSTAMKTFRRSYLAKPIAREVHVHDFIRLGYYGGRTEPFFEIGHHLHYFDVNSSYAYQMTLDMPVGEAHEWSRGEPPRAWQEKMIGFCQVVVHVPEDIPIPPLPVKAQPEHFPKGAGVEGKLIFPVGYLSGVWEWGELQNAIEAGCRIVEWGRSVWFDKKPLLEEFVRTLFRYRNQAKCFTCDGALGDGFYCPACEKLGYDAALDAFAKLLANATYGKFGQNPMRLKFYWITDPEMPDGCVPLIDDDPDCQVWIREEEADAPYIMPQISARITALARVLLHRFAMEAKRRVLRECVECHSKVTFSGKRVGKGWVLGKCHGGIGKHGDELAERRIDGASLSCPCGGSLVTRHGEVYYMDTDAIKTDVLMPVGTELGEWKDEIPRYSGYVEGRFYGPKLYRLSVESDYAELPFEVRRAMFLRDKKAASKLMKDGVLDEEKLAQVIAKPDFEQIKAKGVLKKNRTRENLELLYEGAMERVRWILDPNNRHADGSRRPMPLELQKAGTIIEERLEKIGTLARLVKRDRKGRVELKKGKDGVLHRQSRAFQRGPLMRQVPKRLHLEGAKRIHLGDGTTRPYVVDMRVGQLPTPEGSGFGVSGSQKKNRKQG